MFQTDWETATRLGHEAGEYASRALRRPFARAVKGLIPLVARARVEIELGP